MEFHFDDHVRSTQWTRHMDVGDWLRGLGLGHYETIFRESQIDAEVLVDLTDSDLGQLGIPLGHRKRLLKAIASIRGAGESAAVPNPVTSSPSADRRQLTVMFCDLVGSTALSARLDPEDMADLIRSYQGAVAATAARFEGYVAKLMGDGALVYFGYPRAHEDDAERAVHAGLGLVEAIRNLRSERDVALEVRAGIATGLVVVGELMGEGEARERGVVGDTPNLAARLQALAEPGRVVVAESTRRLLGEAFEFKALGPQALKGFATPTSVWSVVSARQNISRFEASRSETMTSFVGREQEVALLIDRWRAANEGKGQVVLLSGEAGIGKSRVLAELRQRIGSEPHIAMRYQCSPHHSNNAFYPIVGQIWHAAGFVAGEPAPTRLDKLEAMIARSGLERTEIVPYLAALLSIPAEGRYASPELAPGELKERTITALIALFAGLTQSAPVLALLEDVHWIDPTSLDAFNRIVNRVQGLRVLIVVTFRPEFVAPWVDLPHVTELSLNRFERRQAVTMIDRVSGGKALPAEVLNEIVAKTDGVALFVEELTKTVLESGLLREENGAYVLTSALTALAIPSTLQDSLMARLDRLAPVREIAQIGAAIGREFSYSLLEAVSPITGPALEDALRQLLASELIHARGVPPEASYTFKHALVQDTAYSSLLRSRRQRIHADIARALVERFADQVDSAPEIIARHYTEAGLAEPAVRYWLAAAEAALSRSANTEGARYAETGMGLIGRIPEGNERRQLELSLQVVRGNAALALKGYTAPETIEILSQVKVILDSGIGTDMQRFSVLYGLWAANYVAAHIDSAQDLARQYVEVANRQSDPTYLMIGQRIVGAALITAGHHRDGLASLERAYQHYDPVRHKPLSYRFGQDIGLSVLCHQVWALWFIGRLTDATRLSERILGELPEHGHATTVAFCTLYGVIFPAIFARDFDRAAPLGEDLARYCTEHKMGPHYVVAGRLCCTVSRGMREPTTENIESIRSDRQALHRFGVYILDSPFSAALAEISLRAGDAAGARAVLEEAIKFAEESGERYWLAELHRLMGHVALRQVPSEAAMAEASFAQAIEIARRQEAISLELRVTIDLVQARRATGRADALLAPLLNAIQVGGTSDEVSKARDLLAT
jgi:class 3 adenylate cyclase/predicted ATPase